MLRVHMKETLMCECTGVFCLRPCWSCISTCRQAPERPDFWTCSMGLEPWIIYLPCAFPVLPPVVHSLLASLLNRLIHRQHLAWHWVQQSVRAVLSPVRQPRRQPVLYTKTQSCPGVSRVLSPWLEWLEKLPRGRRESWSDR